jgi:AbrB family looped-hinge helix DNA binding protein
MEILGDSKLTSKFQATVPKRVRDILKLDNGDRLVFARVDGQIVVKKGRIKVEA